uniref:Cytochrome b n=1 Tax=Trichobilharzia regenti TaxID=157069 RepID=A7J1K7_TRIRE|nr:cytochrome b [Trichobilharzia regenti]ABG91495.1 cytochrome b [Trichobilharzia regenti]
MIILLRGNLVDLPTNLSLSYFWCGGFMLSIFMVIQVLSGIILSLFYGAENNFTLVFMGFDESILIWLVRYTHIWCVNIVFVLLLIHIGRSLYYGSYSRLGVWNVGFVLYIMIMVEAFLGYILPWHQMSYWAATVLTSILSSVPFVGTNLYSYVVGGFGVTVGETLLRVFPAHVILGIVILGVVIIHLFYLHKSGSSCPLFISGGYSDCVYFHGYYTVKDLYVFIVISFFCIFLMIFIPNMVLDVEAFIKADPLVTPASIKPEWYFLIYYAMLRSIESKVGGLVFVLSFLLVLWVPTKNISSCYSLLRQVVFWCLFGLYIILSYLGGCHAEYPYILISKICSVLMLFFVSLYKGCWFIPYWCDYRLFII